MSAQLNDPEVLLLWLPAVYYLHYLKVTWRVLTPTRCRQSLTGALEGALILKGVTKPFLFSFFLICCIQREKTVNLSKKEAS